MQHQDSNSGLPRAILTRWLVREGDWVEADQPIYEISTHVVDQVIETPRSGRIARLLVQEGESFDPDRLPFVLEGEDDPGPG